ncbi:hypothetical protein Dimus_033215, partial [Dionaea muscipula]
MSCLNYNTERDRSYLVVVEDDKVMIGGLRRGEGGSLYRFLLPRGKSRWFASRTSGRHHPSYPVTFVLGRGEQRVLLGDGSVNDGRLVSSLSGDGRGS